MTKLDPDSPEYKAYEEGWNGERLGTTPRYTSRALQSWVERGHSDSQANHGYGRWRIESC